jgi:hypothetical protein
MASLDIILGGMFTLKITQENKLSLQTLVQNLTEKEFFWREGSIKPLHDFNPLSFIKALSLYISTLTVYNKNLTTTIRYN